MYLIKFYYTYAFLTKMFFESKVNIGLGKVSYLLHTYLVLPSLSMNKLFTFGITVG
jgi:hypothetical protein